MKKENLLGELSFNIHTISAWSDVSVNGEFEGIELMKATENPITRKMKYMLKINPNNFVGKEINTMSEFEQIIKTIKEVVGATEFVLVRVDPKVDSYEANDHYKLLKINRLLVLLIAMQNNLKNRYESFDPLTFEHLTIVAKSDYYEIENYNKSLQSNYSSAASNRLEFRSKALSKRNKDARNVIVDWVSKLCKVGSLYKELQRLCNVNLVAQWHEEKNVVVKSIGEFLRKYHQNIFTSGQLIDLLRRLGYANPKERAYKFKSRSSVEYVTKSDLAFYINAIKKEIALFMTNKAD